LACGCRYCCSSERLKQRSQKSTLGDRSALCSAMAGVSRLMATKSSGGYLEGRRLDSAHSAAPRAKLPPLALRDRSSRPRWGFLSETEPT
jgi:hypothetical protein